VVQDERGKSAFGVAAARRRLGLGAFGLLEDGIEEAVHPVLAREDLPAGAGFAAPGCLDGHRAGVPMYTQKGVDALRVFLGKDGAGGIQELAPGRRCAALPPGAAQASRT